jgi:hypothetical protein
VEEEEAWRDAPEKVFGSVARLTNAARSGSGGAWRSDVTQWHLAEEQRQVA